VARLAEWTGFRDGERWRVFISHTAELRKFPEGGSYVAEVERAVTAAGHVIVDMADFPAADQPIAQACIDRVRSCEVYVGVLGARYGTPVRDRPEVCYTELEFDTATAAGLDRLVFLLDMEADQTGIPVSALVDREFGARQDAFRRRVGDSGLLTQSFGNPATLGRLVERSLRDLAQTRRRIGSGIERERVPAEQQPSRESKFVNPPPVVAPTWFQGRQPETARLAGYVADPGIRMVTVMGRGGIGKTALVCRLLKGLENGRVPDLEEGRATTRLGGIVYLSGNGRHQVKYPVFVTDLLRLLPPHEADRLQGISRDPRHDPAELMLAVLEAFPAGAPVVVLLDNLELAMNVERETLSEPALHQALAALLSAPAHAITVIITTRVTPTALLAIEPARQRQLRLEEGLGSPDAETVLRALDDDGRLGLRDAPGELLDGLRRHTRGFPRALEAVKAILDGDHTLTPSDVLNRTRHLSEDHVVQVLVGEAYELLDPSAQQVMQALSVYPAPVSAVGADFLLRSVNPTIDAATILARLLRRQLVRFQDSAYYLHPVDRDYARSQLPAGGGPDDVAASFTLASLQARAADYYRQIRTPRGTWRSLDDVRPQLAEFQLRCDNGDYDTAATVLNDIDLGYLRVWGHTRTLVDLYERLQGHLTDPKLKARHLGGLGYCYHQLGDYRRAIELYTRALDIDREVGNRSSEAGHLGDLGLSYYRLGDYQRAIKLHTQALDIDREVGNRAGESRHLSNMGVPYQHLGDYRRSIDLLTQALDMHRKVRSRGGEANALGNLALAYQCLGDYQRAIELHTQALDIHRDIGHRGGQGIGLNNLGSYYHELGDYRRAIELHTQALDIDRDVGDPMSEACTLADLGHAWLAAGEARRAETLLGQAVRIADASNSLQPMAAARTLLAQVQLQLGNPAAALATTVAGLELSYPREAPALELLRGLSLLDLERAGEAALAFNNSVAAADSLLALAGESIAGLKARALALSGLTVATGDPALAAEAHNAFIRFDAAVSAAGVIADSYRLLEMIASHDPSNVLAGVRTIQNRD
jgi:tetratricopeptide (TPR) repeat protein